MEEEEAREYGGGNKRIAKKGARGEAVDGMLVVEGQRGDGEKRPGAMRAPPRPRFQRPTTQLVHLLLLLLLLLYSHPQEWLMMPPY